jgi:hypothetical protein
VPRTSTRIASLLIFVIVAVGCTGGSSIPTELEARSFLDQYVAFARAGDVDHMCEVADCRRDDFVDPFVAPSDPPRVIGTWVLEGSSSGGQETIGGRVLVLCGLDPEGAPYRFEMLVFRADGRLRTLSAKYWTNMGVAGGPPVTAPAPPDESGCG